MLRSFLLLPALLPALAFGLRHQDEADTVDLRTGTTFAVDAMHSSVLFRVSHLKAGVFWGRFNDIKGTFKIDDNDLTDSFVKVTIPVESVDTNSKDRDKHLLGPDFFNAKEYPTISFESSKIERAGDKYRAQAMEAGVTLMLAKPYSEDELVRVVRELSATQVSPSQLELA